MNIDVNNINLKKDKKINLTAAAILLVSFITVIGITYAFFAINKQGTGLAANANCYTVNYTKGQDIAGELSIGSDYTAGESTDIVMYADPNCELLTGTIYITTNSNSTMDFSDNALRYTILEGDEVVAEGAINGTENQPIYENFILNTTATTYKVYIWLDEALEDVSSLESELYSGFIHTEVLVSSQLAEPDPNIKLASYIVNGSPVKQFPTTGTYTVDTSSCTNTTMTYDYTEKAFYVSNISALNVSCNPTLTTTTRTPLSTYIKNLVGTNTSVSSTSNNDGSTLEKINSTLDTGDISTDYRYRGIAPNNYIWFNDELWRIIGVFDQYSHGQTGEQLVKIIRNDSIGGYIWDNDTTNSANGDNNFPDSDIYNLLNTSYYNAINGTGADYCYAYGTEEPAKCNFTYGGIRDSYRSMIKNVTWFLGGSWSTSTTSEIMYKYERSTNTSSSYYYSGNAQTITNTPIGLMYASDYGYASPSTCTSNLYDYNAVGCSDNNWLKSNYYEWTITHHTSYSYHVFCINNLGYLDRDIGYVTTNLGYATRPVLYLDSSVYYISGDGTKINPYIIGV